MDIDKAVEFIKRSQVQRQIGKRGREGGRDSLGRIGSGHCGHAFNAVQLPPSYIRGGGGGGGGGQMCVCVCVCVCPPPQETMGWFKVPLQNGSLYIIL